MRDFIGRKCHQVFLVILSFLCVMASVQPVRAQGPSTRIQYLSGTDKDHTVTWGFYCTSGNNAGKSTTIPVPSSWELQDFGRFTYGKTASPVIQGRYTRAFTVPADWAGQRIVLVFEGVQTETTVLVNGKSAGANTRGRLLSVHLRHHIPAELRSGQPEHD